MKTEKLLKLKCERFMTVFKKGLMGQEAEEEDEHCGK